MKGAGYKSGNSGEFRGVVNRVHDMTSGDHPFWAYLEAHGWKRVEAKGEWEFRRYQRKAEIAIFHKRANGNLSMAGHAERLHRGYSHSRTSPTDHAGDNGKGDGE